MVKVKKSVSDVLKAKGGIRLDLGCGENKQKGFVGIDLRKLPEVDIVHDLEQFPYPLPNESCLVIVGSHLVEHIKPWLMLKFMDELWRIANVGCQLVLAHPYGVNELFVQDPTHCNPCNAATWQYFDPRYPLYQVYKTKPWKIEKGFPIWQQSGCMEVFFTKVSEAEGKRMYEKERVYDTEEK
jgi:predicted SAM-dependent methyltransferase